MLEADEYLVKQKNAIKKHTTEIIIDAVKEYNEPLEVIMPAFSTTLRNFAEVTLYPDFIIQGDFYQ